MKENKAFYFLIQHILNDRGRMMKTIAKDNSTGMPLLNCELPSGFKANGQLSYRQYPENRSCYIETSFVKDNCSIVYKTGENYLYEKIRINSKKGIIIRKSLMLFFCLIVSGFLSLLFFIFGNPIFFNSFCV